MFERLKQLWRGSAQTAQPDAGSAPAGSSAETAEPVPTRATPLAGSGNQLIYAASQSAGLLRDSNEDTLFAFSALLAERESEQPVGLFIVADGMGGHLHGDLASGSAVRAAAQYILRNLYLAVLDPGLRSPEHSIQEIMTQAVTAANEEVLRRAPGGGTTITAAIIAGDQLTIAHVGDSRAYLLLPESELQQLTADHSMVHRLRELGHLTLEEAESHPQRNVLYRALGQPEAVQADVETFPFPHDAVLVLCTDGLWGPVGELDIRRIIVTNTPWAASKALLEAANAAGGPDNISVIIAQYV